MTDTESKEGSEEEHSSSSITFTMGDLVNLSLGTPEIGTVNFKILRILLHCICDQLGIDNLPAALGEAELDQIEKFQSYIDRQTQIAPYLDMLQFTGGPTAPSKYPGREVSASAPTSPRGAVPAPIYQIRQQAPYPPQRMQRPMTSGAPSQQSQGPLPSGYQQRQLGQGQRPPSPGYQQGQPGQGPPPLPGYQDGQPGQGPPPSPGYQQGQPGQGPPPSPGYQQGQPGQGPPPSQGYQQGQPGQGPLPPPGYQQGPPPPPGYQQGQPGQGPPPSPGYQQGQPGQGPPPPPGYQQGQPGQVQGQPPWGYQQGRGPPQQGQVPLQQVQGPPGQAPWQQGQGPPGQPQWQQGQGPPGQASWQQGQGPPGQAPWQQGQGPPGQPQRQQGQGPPGQASWQQGQGPPGQAPWQQGQGPPGQPQWQQGPPGQPQWQQGQGPPGQASYQQGQGPPGQAPWQQGQGPPGQAPWQQGQGPQGQAPWQQGQGPPGQTQGQLGQGPPGQTQGQLGQGPPRQAQWQQGQGPPGQAPWQQGQAGQGPPGQAPWQQGQAGQGQPTQSVPPLQQSGQPQGKGKPGHTGQAQGSGIPAKPGTSPKHEKDRSDPIKVAPGQQPVPTSSDQSDSDELTPISPPKPEDSTQPDFEEQTFNNTGQMVVGVPGQAQAGPTVKRHQKTQTPKSPPKPGEEATEDQDRNSIESSPNELATATDEEGHQIERVRTQIIRRPEGAGGQHQQPQIPPQKQTQDGQPRSQDGEGHGQNQVAEHPYTQAGQASGPPSHGRSVEGGDDTVHQVPSKTVPGQAQKHGQKPGHTTGGPTGTGRHQQQPHQPGSTQHQEPSKQMHGHSSVARPHGAGRIITPPKGPGQNQSDHPHPSTYYTTGKPPAGQEAEEQLLRREMRSLILLDLDAIRNNVKVQGQEFDEQDFLERLNTTWEAIKIIKNNEETLAIKILRQDAILKKLPLETIEKLSNIPPQNLDAIATSRWDKPMMLPGSGPGGVLPNSTSKGRLTSPNKGQPFSAQAQPKTASASVSTENGLSSMDKADVQNLYYNLVNMMATTTDHQDKLKRMGDQLRTMEMGMVTKQVLIDALNDKADKGQINTKVSYDEFGTAVEELQTALRDLVMAAYNNNEHWKDVTDNLTHDVKDKLDRAELVPVKAFFKSNIKSLDEKIRRLQRQIEEPDPAGTRKKLLKDFNCISCDKHCNITGFTNGPTLPTIGPILAGHTTASRRAFDLHRMRMKKKFDYDCRDMLLMERQIRAMGALNPDGSWKSGNEAPPPSVNRYQGGSHTEITNAALIKATRNSRNSKQKTSLVMQELLAEEYNSVMEELDGEEEEEMVPSEMSLLQEIGEYGVDEDEGEDEGQGKGEDEEEGEEETEVKRGSIKRDSIKKDSIKRDSIKKGSIKRQSGDGTSAKVEGAEEDGEMSRTPSKDNNAPALVLSYANVEE